MTFALAFLFSGAVAQAQIGSLRGTVTDPQRAVVADAAVSLESVDGAARSTRTAADGTFSFEGVAVGDYTLQVESPGFEPWRQPVAVAGGPVAVDVVMDVAGLAEAVSVTAPAVVALTQPTITASRLGMLMLETPASVHVVSGDTVRERGDASVAQAKSRPRQRRPHQRTGRVPGRPQPQPRGRLARPLRRDVEHRALGIVPLRADAEPHLHALGGLRRPAARRLSENVDLDVRVNNLFDELYATTYYGNVEPQWFLGMPRSAEVALLVGF